MKKISLYIAVFLSLCALPACSDKSGQFDKVDIAKDLVQIDMVATHAIDTEVSVAQLTFVPNSVAPWLGRVILLGENGKIYSTDIEGRSPKPIGSGNYIDIFGLARMAAPGVFLAITDDNKIEAFIESDNDGNFSPMIYSGKNINAKAFAQVHIQNDSTVSLFSTNKKLHILSLTVKDKVVETKQIKPSKAIKAPNIRDAKQVKIGEILSENYVLKPHEMSGLTINAHSANSASLFRVNIKNGLSVGGVEHVKSISSTSSNYGAGGYDQGVIALVDKDVNRIVFISLSYAERQLLRAVNPPQDKQEVTP